MKPEATILVVDDEPAVRKLLFKVLKNAGYLVLQAEDGPAALEQVRDADGHLDLLITDITMPHMTGTELVEQVWIQNPDLRVLCISAGEEPAAPSGCPFLAKPFTPKVLLTMVKEILSQPREMADGRPTNLPNIRQMQSNLLTALTAAQGNLAVAKQEYERLKQLSSDAGDNRDGIFALHKAFEVRLAATAEYNKALDQWIAFYKRRE